MIAFRPLVLLSVSAVLLAGCRVDHSDNGDKKKVNIDTPFGNMKVESNKAADLQAIGISAYPGATPSGDDEDKHHNANVNLNFGDFHLGVRAASFVTQDDSDKVLAFYKKDLGRYGDVLECKGKTPIGQPTRTAQGLTCSDGEDGKHISTDGSGLQVRAGSPTRMHLVSVEPHGGGTKFGIVALDLPRMKGSHSESASE